MNATNFDGTTQRPFAPSDAQAVSTSTPYAWNDVVRRIGSAATDIRSAIPDYQGQVSAVQGNRINQLTLVSVILLPLTFITGYFGMSFPWLVNSIQTFVTWVVLGAGLPVIAVIVSVWLLSHKGFQIGRRHTHRFRVHSHAHAQHATPAPSAPGQGPPST